MVGDVCAKMMLRGWEGGHLTSGGGPHYSWKLIGAELLARDLRLDTCECEITHPDSKESVAAFKGSSQGAPGEHRGSIGGGTKLNYLNRSWRQGAT